MIIDPPSPSASLKVWKEFVADLEKAIAELPAYYPDEDREFAEMQLEKHKLTLSEKEGLTEE